jgi:hypothetical protein
LITVPGLEVRSDWRPVHDRLLDEFPAVTDVLATTIKETILVVSQDAAPGNTDRSLEVISETITNRRTQPRLPTDGTPRESRSADF